MLKTPDNGFRYSANKNNIPSSVLGDWIEASAYFTGERVSKSAVVDILVEDNICSKQDIGNLIADDGWIEIRERTRIVGNSTNISFETDSLELAQDWKTHPIEAFLIMLSIFHRYEEFPGDARNLQEQGIIFELVMEAILGNMFKGWVVSKVGWSHEDPVSISDVIRDIADRLSCEGHPEPHKWIGDHAKDGGLDVVCYRVFGDDKEATPVLFVQCASGKNWVDKIHTPNGEVWKRLLQSAIAPSVGLAAPFVIDADELRRKALQGSVIILDRLRILSAFYEDTSVIDNALKDRIIAWLEPIVSNLPTIDS